MRIGIIGAIVALVLAPAGAGAQTSGTGTFAKLSPGEQKIVRALFEAQTTSTSSNAPTPLTLDEIAAKKRGGTGWGEVFKEMKAQGLLTQKNLGQVVSSFERRNTKGAVTGSSRGEKAPGASASGNAMGRGAGHDGAKR